MKAVVLAAGQGTRLYPFTDLIPKSMLPIGGKPVLAHILDRLRKYGFYDVILCVNQKDIAYFQDYCDLYAQRYNIQITYSISKEPLGSAGEVLNAKQFLKDEKEFLLYFGDELTKVNMDKLVETHKQTRGTVTLALIEHVPMETGVVECESNGVGGMRVTQFREKPPFDKNIWAGIAVIRTKVLDYANIGDDFGKDLFPRLINEEGYSIFGYISDIEWMDTGTFSHFRRAQKLADEGKL